MQSNETGIQKREDQSVLSMSLSNNERVFTNLKPETKQEKQRMFNMISRCDERLNDIENQILNVVGYYIQQIVRKDKETGEPRNGIRTIIVTNEGKSYVTMSSYFGLQFMRLVKTFGSDIKDGIKIKIIKVSKAGSEGQILQFEIVD